MSALSTRRTSLGSRRDSRKTLSSSISMSYEIYCINFYDNGLTAVRNEYINQIKLGLRRFLFVIDLDNEIEQAVYINGVNARSLKIRKPEPLPTDPVALTLLRIQDCLKEYQYVSKRIDSENSFSLLRYYQKNVPAEIKFKLAVAKKDAAQDSKKPKPAKGKETTDAFTKTKIICFGVTSKEHNKVGKGRPLSKRAYIKDQPLTTPILIIIIGTQDNEFYRNLLSYNQPLSGVIHYLPEQCAYDILVPRPRRIKELRETIEGIQRDIHSLRKRRASKPVGVFQRQLPQMSKCQSTKYATDVSDQLTWFLYDIHTLKSEYEEYYVKPYTEIDVLMPAKSSIVESFHLAESLSIEGHYLKTEAPAMDYDDGTIYLYFESLMSTFGSPKELMTEMEVLLLANPSSMVKTRVLDKVKVYANAFKSIIKLSKSERLFVEYSNPLLTSVISYMDQKLMRNIYHACLEYNILRRYFSSGYSVENIHYVPYTEEVEPRHLPKYAQLYLTDDAVTQRIVQLVDEYDNCKVQEIHPNIKLYTFRRCQHEVFEHQKEIVIPTRLCFRDFTLYEMDDFLKDLVTVEMFDSTITDAKMDSLVNYSNLNSINDTTESMQPFYCQGKRQYVVTPSIFVRPKSLKANKLADQVRDRERSERQSARASRAHKDSARLSKKGSFRTDLNQRSSSFVSPEHLSHHGQHSFIGLGPDHPMIKGYNLDDTRQTIKVKTSKYHFDEGLMTLYQEKWNFRQMNKYLNLEINKHEFHFTNARGNMNNISSKIRLHTPNGVHLRIKTNAEECAKAVLHYPNGLSLYCHDTHAEHIWTSQNKDLNETRRICTSYGCVIVFYNENDMVLIMRYNGEVYQLYTNDLNNEEAEGVSESTSESSYVNACSTQSTYTTYKPLPSLEEPIAKHRKKEKKKAKAPSTTRESGGTNPKSKKSTQRLSESMSSQTLAAQAAKAQEREMKNTQSVALFNSIDNELKYLKFIMGLFDINYEHLKLTTALGSVVHVTKMNKIYCAKPIRVTEWHDYFANESYSMRDDGVRMIWTKDDLKCYHADGTVILTNIHTGVDVGVIEDEIDKQISSSSSHEANSNERGSFSMQSNDIYVNMQNTSLKEPEPNVNPLAYDEFLAEAEVEDQPFYDYSFQTCEPNSFLMQHRFYAGTQFYFDKIDEIETTVFAADNLKFRLYPLPLIEASKPDDINNMNDAYKDAVSSDADPDEWTRVVEPTSPPHNQLNLNPGVEIEVSNVRLQLEGSNLQIVAELRKFGCDDNDDRSVRDKIELKLVLNQNLSNVFDNWVEIFHKFIDCGFPKWKTTYFVEATTEDCRKKGLELFKTVPTLGNFNFCAGNFFIDPEELKSIHTRMINNFQWYEKDMAKFPRFTTAKKASQTVEFPSVLNTKIFVEIPAQLAYTDRIHLFLYPFDKIKFRKLKHRFNEAVLFHLYPHLRDLVKQEISKRSWRNHHMAKKRRLFMEQQRLSLYVAMLKHKVYPNYFQFKDQFYNHVRNIDFFEFMASKCNEKDNPDKYTVKNPEYDAEPVKKPPISAEEKKLRKKCLCPKYIKSVT